MFQLFGFCYVLVITAILTAIYIDTNLFFYRLGYCLKVARGQIISKGCLSLTIGCPKEDYFKHEFYKCKVFLF